MSALKQYIDLWEAHREAIESRAPQAMNALREAAYSRLQGARLPRKGEEDYEATDMDALFAPDYGINVMRHQATASLAESFCCDVPNLSTCLWYAVGDTLAPHAAALKNTGEGIVQTFSTAASEHPDLLSQFYGSLADLNDPAVALNTLLAQDGLLIYVPDGVTLPRTVQLVNIFNARADMMALRRVLIVVGKNAKCAVLACDHTQDPDHSYLSSQVVEIIAMEGSEVDYYDLEESTPRTTRVSSVFVKQHADSNVLVNGITLTNGTTRNNYRVEVAAERTQTQLYGMTIAGEEQHVDNHTLIRHCAPRQQSNEMFKYVLQDKAVGAFAGKILVNPHCPKVEAYQGNKNICASPQAKMYTKPQLEIYTDDVRCSHGTAVGRLDEEALFYMRSRGISDAEARRLLMQAFVDDVVQAVRLQPLRDRLRMLVEKRFSGTLSSCAGCLKC